MYLYDFEVKYNEYYTEYHTIEAPNYKVAYEVLENCYVLVDDARIEYLGAEKVA